MSKIKDILSIRLENDIKNVIDLNSQGESDIKEELDNFILTESLANHLSDFLDVFCSDMKESGVWLSGFYGSGKSYFAKMIGYLISNPVIMGTPMRERFKTKLAGLKDPFLLENKISSLQKSSYQAVLFDCAKTSSETGLPYTAYSRFLMSLSFQGNWMGTMQYHLWLEGNYQKFLDTVREQNGGEEWQELSWDALRVSKAFRNAMASILGEEVYDEARKFIEEREKAYDSVKLKDDLGLFLKKHPHHKLVFFIDEVSEALTQGKINILDLEGMAESLSSMGNKVWTICIAQQAFNEVLNATGVSRSLLNKVEARFKTRIPIAAEEINTIIRERLLKKTEEGKAELEDYYNKNSGMIRDITKITGVPLNMTDNAQTYSDHYPFFKNQFKLLQYFLFGTGDLITSQIGTRGMLISVFDVLKKEALTEADVFTHVNASQLCNQAVDNVDEALRIRYEQAQDLLSAEKLNFISGKELMQTIHFLTRSQAQTTPENIAKAYTKQPENYYEVLAEVKRTLPILEEHNILIQAGGQFRITSQTEQQIIDDMNNYGDTIPLYRIQGEINKRLKQMDIVKHSQSLNAVGEKIHVETAQGEQLSVGQASKTMKVQLYDIFYSESQEDIIERIKKETVSDKGLVSVVPSKQYANEVMRTAKDLLKIEYVTSKVYSTQDEKRVVNNLSSQKDDKSALLDDLIRKSYSEGTAVYQYNTYQLTPEKQQAQIAAVEMRMYENLFTRRLKSQLSDALAKKALSCNSSQLSTIFGTSEEFRFFDTSGKFIGDNLSVTQEVTELCKSFRSGAEMEKELKAPPTGYSFGTILTTVAALMRGNKLIAKFEGNEYHSASASGVGKIFEGPRSFEKASFKAVLNSLTYEERRDIVDILKTDCEYKKMTGEHEPSYNMNDFELVDCVRTLSKQMMHKVNDAIMGNEGKEKLFQRSISAMIVFKQFTETVTENSYISIGRQFLAQADDYIAAVERVNKDIKFIETRLSKISLEEQFIRDVEEELGKTGIDISQIQEKRDLFFKAKNSDLVANVQKMEEYALAIKDTYYDLMKGMAEKLSEKSLDVTVKAQNFIEKLNNYPKDWNSSALSEAKEIEGKYKKYAKIDIMLQEWTVKCQRSGLQLRDMEYISKDLSADSQRLDMLEMSIVTEPPKPKPQPAANQPQPKQPFKYSMKGKMPKGTMPVNCFREWLKKQLQFVSKMDDNDIITFD